MNRHYYVDSENVGDIWVTLLSVTEADDEIVVFYTPNSPHMNYRNLVLLMNSNRKVKFIECFEGSNALDFQLCTELGYQLRSAESDEFRILTNDQGYDAVVRYWKKRGCRVSRLGGKACLALGARKNENEAPKNAETAPAEAEAAPAVKPQDPKPVAPAAETARDISEAAPAESACPEAAETENTPCVPEEGAENYAREILYCVGREDLADLHEALVQIYGDKAGLAFYNCFKNDSSSKSFIEEHQAFTREEKIALYCRIVFLQAHIREMPEEFPVFLVESWKKKRNLNSLRAALLGRYGKEKAGDYYSLMKPHVKILEKIK